MLKKIKIVVQSVIQFLVVPELESFYVRSNLLQPLRKNYINRLYCQSVILCVAHSSPELKRALKSNANAAPGFDNVQYIMLEKLPPSAKNNPSNIFEKNFIR